MARNPMAANPTAVDPMPMNPIEAPGTDEATWRAWPGLARLPAADVTAWSSAVILAAHPDDEVLGVGGIISVLARAGARLRVVAVTDGQASHPGHGRPAELARRRAQERAEALAELGAGHAEVIRLGLPDSGLKRCESELAAALPGLISGFDVCLAPWAHDVHADHEAVGRAARAARGVAYWYPIWAWRWARPAAAGVPWTEAVRVPLPPGTAASKQAAISRFASQLEPRGAAGPVLSADFVTHFTRDFEVLFPVRRP
jgi:LmbE family N-acetylglucosaminyl deacetylase